MAIGMYFPAQEPRRQHLRVDQRPPGRPRSPGRAPLPCCVPRRRDAARLRRVGGRGVVRGVRRAPRCLCSSSTASSCAEPVSRPGRAHHGRRGRHDRVVAGPSPWNSSQLSIEQQRLIRKLTVVLRRLEPALIRPRRCGSPRALWTTPTAGPPSEGATNDPAAAGTGTDATPRTPGDARSSSAASVSGTDPQTPPSRAQAALVGRTHLGRTCRAGDAGHAPNATRGRRPASLGIGADGAAATE